MDLFSFSPELAFCQSFSSTAFMDILFIFKIGEGTGPPHDPNYIMPLTAYALNDGPSNLMLQRLDGSLKSSPSLCMWLLHSRCYHLDTVVFPQ